VRIVASGVDGLEAEVHGARKKADLLAVATGLKIAVEAEG
jgi:hypothetical protein